MFIQSKVSFAEAHPPNNPRKDAILLRAVSNLVVISNQSVPPVHHAILLELTHRQNAAQPVLARSGVQYTAEILSFAGSSDARAFRKRASPLIATLPPLLGVRLLIGPNMSIK